MLLDSLAAGKSLPLELFSCPECGCLFAVMREHAEAVRELDGLLHCPAGHQVKPKPQAGSPMRFRIGPKFWSVRIESERIISNGNECDELAHRLSRTLRIAGDVPPTERLRLLMHCYKHACQMMLGLPADVEADADQFAALGEDFWQQLNAQGGELALMALKPEA